LHWGFIGEKAPLATPFNLVHSSSPIITAGVKQSKALLSGLEGCLRLKVITNTDTPLGIVTPRENIEISAAIDADESDLSF
jgi:hypothetical protein